MRRVLAAVLLAAAFPMAPTAHAEPETCPAVCDRIPNTAWIAPGALPLNTVYRWPRPADIAQPGPPRFRFEELCATPTVPDDPRNYAVRGQATVVNPDGQWQLDAQILHWRGETWRGGELTAQAYRGAVDAVLSCQRTAPAQSPSLTVEDGRRMAAVISGPLVVHTYLVSHPASSTLAALTLWSTSPPAVGWPILDDTRVLDALAAPLCAAYLGSCG